MKKLIPFGTVCILACMALSSCNSSFEITKRRYNKGYYIDHSSKKEISFVTKEKTTQVKNTTPSYPLQSLTGQKSMVSTTIPMSAKANTVITKIEKQGNKTVIATNTRQIMNNLPTTTETSSVQTVSSTLNSITDDGDNHSRGDGLSLFWLIILIILIVWAIGLLAGGFGLGGLINILLVIALILLILWLFRIV
jgi:hypothetical protein